MAPRLARLERHMRKHIPLRWGHRQLMKRKRESSDDDDDYVDDDDGTDLIFSQGDLQHSRLIRKFSLKIEKIQEKSG